MPARNGRHEKKRKIVCRIGVLPQGFSSFDRITVRETLPYYSRLFNCRNTDIDGLIEPANLKRKRDERFNTLSGGLKHRLGIVIALVNNPEVARTRQVTRLPHLINRHTKCCPMKPQPPVTSTDCGTLLFIVGSIMVQQLFVFYFWVLCLHKMDFR